MSPKTKQKIKMISIDKLVRDPFNLRPENDITEQMVAAMSISIQRHGVVEPIVVRRIGKKRKWFVIEGMIRLAGAIKAGLTNVPCRIVVKSDEQAASLSWAGRTKTPFSKAAEYQAIWYFYNNVCLKEVDKTAAFLGVSRGYVGTAVKTMKLMEKGIKSKTMGGNYSPQTIEVMHTILRDKKVSSYITNCVPKSKQSDFQKHLADVLESTDKKLKRKLGKMVMDTPFVPIDKLAKELPSPDDKTDLIVKLRLKQPLAKIVWKKSEQERMKPDKWVLSYLETTLLPEPTLMQPVATKN